MPILLDVIRSLFRPQVPGDVTAVADLMIRGQDRYLAFSTQLIADLPVQGFLVGFDRQEEVGPLLLELSKNGRCVWSASAWMSTPSRSSSPSSFWSTARS